MPTSQVGFPPINVNCLPEFVLEFILGCPRHKTKQISITRASRSEQAALPRQAAPRRRKLARTYIYFPIAPFWFNHTRPASASGVPGWLLLFHLHGRPKKFSVLSNLEFAEAPVGLSRQRSSEGRLQRRASRPHSKSVVSFPSSSRRRPRACTSQSPDASAQQRADRYCGLLARWEAKLHRAWPPQRGPAISRPSRLPAPR